MSEKIIKEFKLKAPLQELLKLEPEFSDRDVSALCNESRIILDLAVPNGAFIHWKRGYQQLCYDTQEGIALGFLKSKTMAELKQEAAGKYWSHLDAVYFIRHNLKSKI